MSNQALGNVYSLIMNDVIESCQTTFEEDGVNQQTLEELRTTWERKLTGLHVGQFPWEPAPAPQPMPGPFLTPTIPSLPSNAPRGPVPSSAGASSSENGSGPARVKQEPDQNPQNFQTNGLPPNYGNNVARERAAQNLQQKFGPEAQSQIQRLQAQTAMNTPQGQNAAGAGEQYPQASQMTDKQRAELAAYQRAQAQSAARAANQAPVANNARTDGADEWEDLIERNRESSQRPEVREGADLTLRERLEEMQDYNEGGLFLSLSERPKRTAKYGRRGKPAASGPSNLDGPSDDEEEEESKSGIKDELFDDEDDDADAINSDLDDPDDNAIEEEQDEGRPNQIMLCTYDKVQRVKNKWKCTLKDGVLNTGGKDYVFTKANGEFEW